MIGRVVSLFCGAGGLDYGFARAGFSILRALDSDRWACLTYSESMRVEAECVDVVQEEFQEADLVIGGPPCQGVSNYRGSIEHRKPFTLFRRFIEVVKECDACGFVMENVRGLATMYQGVYLRRFLRLAESAGYNVAYFALNAKDFGVAQSRTRIFFIGFKKSLDVEYEIPEPTHGPLAGTSYVTIGQALRGMPSPEDEDVCFESFSPVYWSRNRRRGWDDVSWVIPAWCRHVPLHPDSPPLEKRGGIWAPTAPLSRYRRFSWFECAALQGFPRWWSFLGGAETKYRLVGNAVPPPVALAVAKSLKAAKLSEAGAEGSMLIKASWRPRLVGGAGSVKWEIMASSNQPAL